MSTIPTLLPALYDRFGSAVREHVALGPFTSARIGGPADVLLTVKSAEELSQAVEMLTEESLSYLILGGGSNILVSDRGVSGLVVLNRARGIRFMDDDRPSVRAESGTTFSNMANRCASKGFGGLEWAAAVPGSVGGAVYGNAGAFESDVAGTLKQVEVLSGSRRETWSCDRLGYSYRSSALKRGEVKAIILAAAFSLVKAPQAELSRRVEEILMRRKATQPPGASMGSMFKNPPGDFAGRLIEAAGLKGRRIGNAEISPIHANFFVNHGRASADDVRALIELARRDVLARFGVELELEIELVGEW